MSTPNVEAFRDWTHENFFTKGEIIKMFSDANYSTSEQIVGTWIDNKPVYSKTFVFDPVLSVPNATWTDFETNVDYVDAVVYSMVRGTSNKTHVGYAGVYHNAQDRSLQVFHLRGTEIAIQSITVFYTKTTD